MINALPRAKALLADRGYDADWFRHALAERGIAACIPSKTNRKVTIPHDTGLYRQRHRIENMFGKLKDWRRIHTRYDRCAHSTESIEAFEAFVANESCVLECYSMSGEWDYLLQIVACDVEGYETFLMRKLLKHPSVAGASSQFSLRIVKYTTAIPC